jgi:N-acetylglutamate synthase-like GNAT family acetyltransferase
MVNNHKLKKVKTNKDWETYHRIRKKILFDNQGKTDYNKNHPDEKKENNYPFLLVFNNYAVGVVRIDIIPKEKIAHMRKVAIIEKEQGKGNGTILVNLVEKFAIEKNCKLIFVHSAPTSSNFYKKLRYKIVSNNKNNNEGPLMKKELM